MSVPPAGSNPVFQNVLENKKPSRLSYQLLDHFTKLPFKKRKSYILLIGASGYLARQL